MYLPDEVTHIKWLHPRCADRIFRIVTSTKQYDRETRTGEISIYGRSKIIERIFVDERPKKVEKMNVSLVVKVNKLLYGS